MSAARNHRSEYNDNFNRAFGNIVRCQRTAIDLTIEQLAEKLDMSISQLARCERGERGFNLREGMLVINVLAIHPHDIKGLAARTSRQAW